jgi:hypothetical protein
MTKPSGSRKKVPSTSTGSKNGVMFLDGTKEERNLEDI